MRHVIAVIVRLAALGVALTLYTLLVVPQMGEAGDASIGAGLIAFAALMVIGFAGALFDARREGFPVAVVWWLVIAAGLAIGWWIALAVPQDSSSSFGDNLATDADLLPFTFFLVAVPALVGAAIGKAIRP